MRRVKGRDLYSNVPPLLWAASMEEEAAAVGAQGSAGAPSKLYPHASSSSSPSSPPLPCTVLQRAGDVLFVPNMWSHQLRVRLTN